MPPSQIAIGSPVRYSLILPGRFLAALSLSVRLYFFA
jgi:hypothetical protein